MASTAPAEASLDGFLETQPAPLVALVGQKPLHACLSGRSYKPDELHAKYISLDTDTMQLDYQPGQGGAGSDQVVLKRDWLQKHTHVLCAVVALWFKWESDTSTARVLEALEKFRSRGRPNIKIVLVLVGTASALASQHDDRLTALRKAAELDSKSLLSLPLDGADRVDEGAARKVEKVLLELAVAYYKDESRRNKSKRDKTAPPHILARHHFKRAYYSEFRRDTCAATAPPMPPSPPPPSHRFLLGNSSPLPHLVLA